MRARKKPVEVDVNRWWRNGDHPQDNCEVINGLVKDGLIESFLSEGNLVQYFRHPGVEGPTECKHCGRIMHEHGWIDTLEGGHIVCPGDWIITGVQGEYYPCKPDIFEKTYDIIDKLDNDSEDYTPEERNL